MSFHSRKVTGLLIGALAIMAGLGTPQAQQGKPGNLIRAEPLANAPAGSMAYRILYRSTGLKGEPIAVSGVVVIPGGDVPPRGRDIVAWAHPTTGVVPRCAPSLRPGVLGTIPGLREMLARDYIVTVTD